MCGHVLRKEPQAHPALSLQSKNMQKHNTPSLCKSPVSLFAVANSDTASYALTSFCLTCAHFFPESVRDSQSRPS